MQHIVQYTYNILGSPDLRMKKLPGGPKSGTKYDISYRNFVQIPIPKDSIEMKHKIVPQMKIKF